MLASTKSTWALLLLVASAAAHANIIETYDAGTADLGNWYLTTTPGNLRTIETTGGDPDGWLHAQVQGGIAAWGTSGSNAFTGDWAGEGVQSLGVDLQIVSTTANPENRAVTLDLQWGGHIDAFYQGPDLSVPLPTGWNHYDFDVSADGGAIPTGWVVTNWDGTPGTNADWQQLMEHIDHVSIGYYKFMYGYPSMGQWDLGMDNIELVTSPVPEPGTAGLMALGLGVATLGARRRSAGRKIRQSES